MGIGALLKFFLPQDDKFIGYFEQAAENLRKAGVLYAGLAKVNSREEMVALRDQIRDLEHVGDNITHRIFEELNRSFITPFDREDIYELTKRMDDVLDLIDHVADLMVLYQIDKLDEGYSLLLQVAHRSIEEICRSVGLLRKMSYAALRDHIVRVHELENEGDRLHNMFVGRLFAEETDAIRLMKLSSLLDEMEFAIDRCEDMMNSLESIMLKNA